MRVATLNELIPALEAAGKVCVCGHVNPDGDALGSVSALARLLSLKGKDVTMMLAEEDGQTSLGEVIPRLDEFVAPSKAPGPFDLFIGVDVPNIRRLGDAEKVFAASGATMLIDHHPDTIDEADLVFTDSDAAAAGMLVWELSAKMLGFADLQIATACYVAILTDTGRFQYQNTDARCLRAASELVEAGVRPDEVAVAVYQNRSMAALTLESRLIDRIVLSDDGTIAYSWISSSDIEELEATKDDTESLTDALRSVRGTSVAVLLREQDGQVRGSLRAKGDEDVGEIARSFGGGGHKAAAGFTFEGSLSECLSLLRGRLEPGFEAGRG